MRKLIVAAAVAAVLGPAAAHAQFVEPNVKVLHTLAGETSGELFGYAIAQIADLDDDGATDLIVGAPFASDEQPFGGRAYVFSGRTGALLHRLAGAPGDLLGWSEAEAGDVDGDGVPDLLVGAPGAGGGHVTLYSGRDGSVIDRLSGELAGDFFGFAVGGTGDLDGDGVPDFVVGAGRASDLSFRQGRVYVYSGRDRTLLRVLDGEKTGDFFGSGIAGTGDLDGDGRGDFIVGARNAGPTGQGRAYVYSGATGQLLFPPLEPAASGADFGWFFVATPGDVDGDGRPDLFVGDVTDTANGPASGRAYVFSGRDARALYQFAGQAGDGAGEGRGAGDVNGDRRADLIVGAYTSSAGAPQAGKATVYSGCDGAVVRTITSTTAGETLGYDAVGIGDVDGDREADFAISAALADRVYLVAGARTCIADFNRDGTVDGKDPLAILVAILRRDPRADTNCDGRIDLHDYLTFLRAVLIGCG